MAMAVLVVGPPQYHENVSSLYGWDLLFGLPESEQQSLSVHNCSHCLTLNTSRLP